MKALGHPLRLRILRLCGEAEWTNAELARRLDRDPSTTLRHVRQLVDAGFLEVGEIRTGARGALEKPYRSTGLSWFVDAEPDQDKSSAMLDAFRDEVAEVGPEGAAGSARLYLHLSDEELRDLMTRLHEILDELVRSDPGRRGTGRPAYGGLVMFHRLLDQASAERRT